jgi:hypothetical protein
VACGASGCETYRVERHKRSPIYFNEEYVEGGVVTQTTLEDGTVVYFEPVQASSSYGRTGDRKGEPFKIREESPDGEVTLRALLPEHVLMNLFNCLRLGEYDVLYDKLLSRPTREAWESSTGFDGFSAYMQKNQIEIARLARRMLAGLPHQEVKFTRQGDYTRCQLRPQVGGQFAFKAIDVVRQPDGQYRLHMIQ